MLCLRLLVLILAACGIVSAGVILTADFEDGTTQGWTIITPWPLPPRVGGDGPYNIASGGVAGSRYLQATDTADGTLYFQAPAAWSGNLLGGTLTFYLRNTNPNTYPNLGDYDEPVVRIFGDGRNLYYYNRDGANLDWTLNIVPFVPGSGWQTSGRAATVAEVEGTLSYITGIYISADWVSRYEGKPGGDFGPDVTGLDQVDLIGVPEPVTFLLIATGLMFLRALGRRR